MKNITYYFLRTFYTKFNKLKDIYEYNDIPKDLLEKCPGCSSSNISDFDSMDRYGFNVETSWCSNCGLIFVNPRINMENYNKLYMDGHYRKIIDAVSKEKQKKLDVIPKRLSLVLTKIVEIYKNKEINILDIGGTSGIYEYLNSNLNINQYLCVNPGADEADIGKTSNVNVANTTIEEYEITDTKYDLIILFGTISHLMYPYEAFIKSQNLLKDDGLFILDFKDTLQRMHKVNFPFLQLHFDHPLYFSKNSLEVLIANTGLLVSNKISYENGVAYYFLSKNNEHTGADIVKTSTEEVALVAKQIKKTNLLKIFLSKIFKRLN